ncbi:MAG: hypothetical protein KC729_06445 [Candidatus Eisenbacteria bacterium]|uniref:Uncharacterized protein n=1 Tax=Eiseniibacteriota bacterium TaxID=2212470 RepID=A0A956LX09_UNCEI|nr:hypothetical protein [Candidatus Eisenbacteria bacterium]
MALEQWVNLPKDDEFKDSDTKSKLRMGAVTVKVSFKKASFQIFRVRAILQDADPEYSPSEQGRNANFKMRTSPLISNWGQANVDVETEVPLLAAGGCKYTFEAMSATKVVSCSTEVVARRKLWYQAMAMKGVAMGGGCDKMEAEFWKPDKNYYIKIERVGGRTNLPFKKTVDASDGDQKNAIYNDMGSNYQMKKKDPYAFAIAFLNYVARSEIITEPGHTTSFQPGKFSGDVSWTVTTSKYLWCDLDDADDTNKSWFRSGTLRYLYSTPDGTKYTSLALSKSMVEVGSGKDFAEGGRKKIKIKIPKSFVDTCKTKGSTGTLRVSFRLRVVKKFLGGFSAGSLNAVIMATKAWWAPKNVEALAPTIVHEVGHKVGMTARGTGLYPDTHGKHYTGQGHQGNHCSKGATYNAASGWSGTPGCTMFGATSIGSKKAPIEFCDLCEPHIQKLDLAKDALVAGGFAMSLALYS